MALKQTRLARRDGPSSYEKASLRPRIAKSKVMYLRLIVLTISFVQFRNELDTLISM